MQRMFTRLALVASDSKSVDGISYETGMDKLVLKTHLDEMVAFGEAVYYTDGNSINHYSLVNGKEGREGYGD